MRRKRGSLVPTETSILETAIEMRLGGAPDFHGFLIARQMREREGALLLTAHGTLYKALDRLQRFGFLESEWEDPLVAANEGRPRRRLYRVTAAGEAAVAAARKPAQHVAARRTGLVAP